MFVPETVGCLVADSRFGGLEPEVEVEDRYLISSFLYKNYRIFFKRNQLRGFTNIKVLIGKKTSFKPRYDTMDRILESKVLLVVYPNFVTLFSFPSMIFFFKF